MAGISQNTMESQKDMAYIAKDMASAAGVQLNVIMKDIATMSNKTLTMISRLPNVVLRTAIEAKRMGTSLQQIANSSREILNYTESVQSEMEASVLLGRGINLQRARELAYRKDLIGSTKEILRISKSVDFENLDVFQAEAFAKATGKTVDELLKMIVAERQWEQARLDPKLAGKVAAYDKMRASNEASLKANAKNTELMLMQKNNQELLTAISLKWQQIMAKASVVLLPLVNGLLQGALYLMDYITQFMIISRWAGNILNDFGQWFIKWSKIKSEVKSTVILIKNIDGTFRSVVMTLTTASKSLGFIGKSFAMLGKLAGFAGVLGPLGWIITGFQFLHALVVRYNEFVGKDGMIVAGIKAIAYALYDALLKPFVDAVAWLLTKCGLIGHSPSLIGLAIVKGITSIGSSLFSALVVPFTMAFSAVGTLMRSFVTGLGAGISIILTSISAGIASFGNPATLLGAATIGVLGLALIPFAYSAKLAGQAMVLLGNGFTTIVSGMKDLQTITFTSTISQMYNLITAMKDLSKEIQAMPEFDFEKFKSMETRATAMYIPAVTITPEATKLEVPETKPLVAEKLTPENMSMTEATGQKLYEVMCGIRDDLSKGKIQANTYMDGQLLSATLARQTEFRGGYGVNKLS
jgi:hypothetical protein